MVFTARKLVLCIPRLVCRFMKGSGDRKCGVCAWAAELGCCCPGNHGKRGSRAVY